MSEKDIKIWNDCCQELSPECQQEADALLRRFTKNLKAHADAYNMRKRRDASPGYTRKSYERAIGKTGAKELIIALIKKGYL